MRILERCTALSVTLPSVFVDFSKDFIHGVIIWDDIPCNIIQFCTVCHYMAYGVMLLSHALSFLAFAKISRVSATVRPTKLFIKTSLN